MGGLSSCTLVIKSEKESFLLNEVTKNINTLVVDGQVLLKYKGSEGYIWSFINIVLKYLMKLWKGLC